MAGCRVSLGYLATDRMEMSDKACRDEWFRRITKLRLSKNEWEKNNPKTVN